METWLTWQSARQMGVYGAIIPVPNARCLCMPWPDIDIIAHKRLINVSCIAAPLRLNHGCCHVEQHVMFQAASFLMKDDLLSPTITDWPNSYHPYVPWLYIRSFILYVRVKRPNLRPDHLAHCWTSQSLLTIYRL